MVQINDQDVRALKIQLDKLQEALEIANENGLLKDDSTAYQTILNHITDALGSLSQNPPDIIKARKEFSLAYFEFNRSVNSSKFRWRFTYSLGGPIAAYLVVILTSIFLAWILYSPILLESKVLWVPSWAFLWGSAGSVLQGFWWLWQHVSDRSLRKHWFVWYSLLPLIGAILGALMYLIFHAGFIAATGETQLKSDSFPMLLSALAGFSSRWAIQSLDKLTTVIKIG
jgi:hypothetical protein